MIAALSGSTALPAIDVFHALLAGNGRLMAPRTVALVTAAAPVVTFEGVADDDVAALRLGVALVVDDVAEGVDEDPAPRLSCASAACVAAWVQPLASRATTTKAVVRTYSWGRRTVAG
jgi:hypothetical protein